MREKIIKILLVTILLFVGVAIWWNTPTSIINIEPSKVSKIDIFSGMTGKSITITDKNEIEYIIKNLNNVSLKKEKISLGYMGYSYRITVYKANEKVYKNFIINSNETIRKDPFFYNDSKKSIDYNFIKKLFE